MKGKRLKSEVLGQHAPIKKPWYHAFMAYVYTLKCSCKCEHKRKKCMVTRMRSCIIMFFAAVE